MPENAAHLIVARHGIDVNGQAGSVLCIFFLENYVDPIYLYMLFFVFFRFGAELFQFL